MRLVSLVLSLNCSAMILEVTKVGIAASKMVIFATSPLIPRIKAKTKTIAGAKINLYNIEVEIWGINFFQPLNLSCNPTENKAKGPTVAANLSKNGSAIVKFTN